MKLALVLRVTNYSKKILILDLNFGLIEVTKTDVNPKINLVRGSLICYNEINESKRHISGLDIIAFPYIISNIDIIFFHHLLEILVNFLPEQKPYPEVFAKILKIFKEPIYFEQKINQKIFVCEIFNLIGIYPNLLHSEYLKYYNLISSDLNSIVSNSEELDKWLSLCIMQHPMFFKFKTLEFLNS